MDARQVIVNRICRLALGLVAVASAPRTAGAQAANPLLRQPTGGEIRSFELSASMPARLTDPAGPAEQAWWRPRVSTPVSIVGGAVVGAWLGYFLSQVVKSDWEGTRGGERTDHRRRFAFSGAAVGAIGGYLVRPRPRAPGQRDPQGPYFYVPRTSRHYIDRLELWRAPVVNALEAIQVLRPEWLEPTYVATHAATGNAPSAASDDAIAVYVVDTRLNGPDALSEIAIPELEELRFYERGDAERRWGRPHPRGAIEVVPAVAQGAK